MTEEDILQLLDHLRMNLKREQHSNFIKPKNSLVHSLFLWTKRKLIFLVCHSIERTSLYKIDAMFSDKNMEHLILLKRYVTVFFHGFDSYTAQFTGYNF